MTTEMICPKCRIERADYEGPNGAHLPTCPNCGSNATPSESRVEDDPANLIDWLIVEHMQGEDNGTTRDQLRWALEKLIDERVTKALREL